MALGPGAPGGQKHGPPPVVGLAQRARCGAAAAAPPGPQSQSDSPQAVWRRIGAEYQNCDAKT